MGGFGDHLIVTPDMVDLSRSPLRRGVSEPTFVLGAFNPGLTRLPGGNLLLMVRVAEALRDPVRGDRVRQIRWTPQGYVLDARPLADVVMDDPRFFTLKGTGDSVIGLTSFSWLLPVELSADAREIVAIHYDRAITPCADYEQYGVEDARISVVGGAWQMVSCGVSSLRHCTVLRRSVDGMEYRPVGVVLDHQNKDMALFHGKVGDRFFALTRPLGESYLAPPPGSAIAGGPSVNLAQSPDGLHWKPCETGGIRPRRGSQAARKVGGGAPPVLTPEGWLVLYHGVDRDGAIGAYRTFWALLDRDDPNRLLHVADEAPLLEADPALTAPLAEQMYLSSPIVFTTGIAEAGDHYIVASGEADLACRISYIPKSHFA
ncbi:glycosidase [Stakelama saccharophila]|uniref:Glycosidase n=1 Tax=Stakelama saccharophila TaxID=3075605 RepID=A0ABZ0BA27_9SPHN|nr:glycosidase [Stakelama sp. W311]WNO53935.1 glycosidase [Stakelama sp. W311]